MPTQSSMPLNAAHNTIITMSVNLCNLFSVSRRGEDLQDCYGGCLQLNDKCSSGGVPKQFLKLALQRLEVVQGVEIPENSWIVAEVDLEHAMSCKPLLQFALAAMQISLQIVSQMTAYCGKDWMLALTIRGDGNFGIVLQVIEQTL